MPIKAQRRLEPTNIHRFGRGYDAHPIPDLTAIQTASYEALIPLAFCTYNGSLTAADGKYYCAAIARSNPPSWCTPITSISTASPYASSFVVLTSGCDLVLPYLCYMQTLSWGTY